MTIILQISTIRTSNSERNILLTYPYLFSEPNLCSQPKFCSFFIISVIIRYKFLFLSPFFHVSECVPPSVYEVHFLGRGFRLMTAAAMVTSRYCAVVIPPHHESILDRKMQFSPAPQVQD